MNLIDCYVMRVLDEPERRHIAPDTAPYWALQVEYIAEGTPGIHELWLDTEAEARSIGPGYHFLA